MLKALKVMVPVPPAVIVFEAPLNVMVPADAVKEQAVLTVKSPEIEILLLAVIVPAITQLWSCKPFPVIVLLLPVMVKVAPEPCVNVPVAEVDKLPATLILVDPDPVIPVPEKARW